MTVFFGTKIIFKMDIQGHIFLIIDFFLAFFSSKISKL